VEDSNLDLLTQSQLTYSLFAATEVIKIESLALNSSTFN